jgi:hypothetical protein
MDEAEANHAYSGSTSKANRATVFVKWLLSNIEIGDCVLDAAGGQGDVSFQLSVFHGVPSTVVDPRAPRDPALVCAPQIRKLLLRKLNRRYPVRHVYKDELSRAVSWRDVASPTEAEQLRARVRRRSAAEPLDPPFRTPHAVRSFILPPKALRQGFGESLFCCRGCGSGFQSRNKLMKHVHETRGRCEGPGGGTPGEGVCAVASKDATEHILAVCTSIVAMHPDQATEPAVDHAIRRGVPFAVVPCCVCWRAAPDRRLRSGEAVRTYEQFLQYLTEKSVPRGRVQRAELGFGGRNVVVFWTGKG